MRNKYAGLCYRCGKTVPPEEGYFERHNGGWRTQHVACCEQGRAEREAAFVESLTPEKRKEYERWKRS